jgi:transcriptional regulator with XRE-family HTH domain
MGRSAYREEYGEVLKVLTRARKRRGVTQHELSMGLGSPQSFVSKYENGGRHLDVVEFIRISYALGSTPHALINEILEAAPGLRGRIRRRPRSG